jgi:hypothetical protein
VFDPQTDHEKEYAKDRIQRYEKQQIQIALREELAEKNKGINLGVDERVARIERGIQH